MSNQGSQRNRRRPPSRPGAAAPAPSVAAAPRRRGAWRAKMDPYGGLTTILIVLFTIVFLGVLAINAGRGALRGVSTEDLRGVEVAIAAGSHTTNPADLIVPEGEPPAGGPHFPTPLQARKYDDPVQDGNAIHSLEHGMIWITYNRDLISADDLKKLEKIQGSNSRDVLLSPRPENRIAIGVVSWGRLLRLDKVDDKAINDFIKVNRDRSPEPGVR